MSTHQPTLDDMTVYTLQAALDHLRTAMEPHFQKVVKDPLAVDTNLIKKAEEHGGYIPKEKFIPTFGEVVAGKAGSVFMATIAKVTGMTGREMDAIPPFCIVEGKGIDVRKFLLSRTLMRPLAPEVRMRLAFNLADVDGNGFIDLKYECQE